MVIFGVGGLGARMMFLDRVEKGLDVVWIG